ncbi:hypothetical protein EUAN_20040 [Andreesenia angusta]|uniref:Flagellar operon protein n=1 Tax=Andreesenia angusta TaxID=39480 RepID=A0A1S1V4G7_9FIRM|nr:hypothetical protein [Andreesenia angusta]OHW61566.1 hypothetical protein EUAN_20040 [Andreesenia angusta]
MGIGGHSICKRCERFFKQNGRDFCDRCHGVMDGEGKYIRDYIEHNPGASIMDMSLDLNISMKNINLFLENQGSFLTIVGEEKELAEELKSPVNSEKSYKSVGMYMTRRRRR